MLAWCGAVFMWLSFPLTLAAAFYFLRRVRKLGLLDAWWFGATVAWQCSLGNAAG